MTGTCGPAAHATASVETCWSGIWAPSPQPGSPVPPPASTWCCACPTGQTPPRVVADAAARGLHVTDLADYRVAHAGPPGLVLGYGNIATPDVPEAVGVLARAIAVAVPSGLMR